MTAVKRIFVEEWRYWIRSRLAVSATLLLSIVILSAVVSTVSRVQSETDTRESLQRAAEEAFLAQPDRHPHRMVHYGHYVFRTPAPLAVVDPGVDPLTGTVVFLEGHRQNSATFPAAYSSPSFGGFAALTPAFAYQVLAPLLLIVVGFPVLARERELQTDVQLSAQGVSPAMLWSGKSLALLGLSAVLLVPLLASASLAIGAGEPLLTAGLLVVAYFLYLAFWSFAVVGISARASSSALSLLWCSVVWIGVAVLAPRVASDIAGAVAPVTGKIESDLALVTEMREVGDGHNDADPAFENLRARVLQQYEAERLKDLPVNFRGIVAEDAEARLTDVLNRYAEDRMQEELQQARIARAGAIVSPMLAIRNVSMLTSGSDLASHHRFLREAEAARFEFVQGLNRLHASELAYADDINRSDDPDAERRTRVSSDNWRVLKSFDFRPAPASERLLAAVPGLVLLMLWCAAAGWFAYRGLQNTGGQDRAA